MCPLLPWPSSPEEEQQRRRVCRSRGSLSSCSASSSSGPARGTGMVVIVGAMGTGKTKKSIDAASAVGGKVVNVDKVQLYTGMDVTTNKVGFEDHHGVAHHLGCIRPNTGELLPSMSRSLTACLTSASTPSLRRPGAKATAPHSARRGVPTSAWWHGGGALGVLRSLLPILVLEM